MQAVSRGQGEVGARAGARRAREPEVGYLQISPHSGAKEVAGAVCSGCKQVHRAGCNAVASDCPEGEVSEEKALSGGGIQRGRREPGDSP